MIRSIGDTKNKINLTVEYERKKGGGFVIGKRGWRGKGKEKTRPGTTTVLTVRTSLQPTRQFQYVDSSTIVVPSNTSSMEF